MSKIRFIFGIALFVGHQGLKSQTYCYAENFVATELRIEPTDSLIEDNLAAEIPLKSSIKILYKTDNGHYFVSFGNKFGYINAATVTFKEPSCCASLAFHPHFPANTENRDINSEIKQQVEEQVNQWQQKGEFEKSADYQKRVNENTRNNKIKEVSQAVIKALKDNELFKITNETFALSEYDADHESFLVRTSFYGDFALKVPMATAPSFKAEWNQVSFKNIDFEIRNRRLFISKIDFYFSGKEKEVFSYDDKNAVTYENTKISYNFQPIKIENISEVKSNNSKNKDGITAAGASDIDSDIPKCSKANDNYFAVIIGNENYAKEIKVNFAAGDARSVREYFVKTLGIPERNIHYQEDATYGQMLSEIDWLNGIAKAYAGKVKLYFYYAGHGVPNTESKSSYLLPVDGYATNTETAIKTEYLYSKLVQNKPELTTVFLDACFSGAAREGMLADGRGVSIKPKKDALGGKIIVFSAASESETAYPYNEKAHGLFTYFLLKKIRDTKGDVTAGELEDYIRSNVNQQSMVLHSKNQTPSLSSGPELGTSSRSLKIR
jgi:hypothetical protein